MPTSLPAEPKLERGFGLLQATALNMCNMIGIGPFVTIPLLMTALAGPMSMLGWAIALIIVVADGLIWAELGAAFPKAGGSYVYLREAYGRWGRLMGFLFIWQFILSGPLEIASGFIGFGQYLSYIAPGLTPVQVKFSLMALGLVCVLLLYRKISSIGPMMVSIWVGVMLTVAAVIVSGALNFDAGKAFSPGGSKLQFSIGFLLGLGAASRVGIYDYLGYYDICYLGGEVRNPGKVIPRSILLSVFVVALIYVGINLSIVGVIPWQEFVPADKHPESAFIVSTFMERLYGTKAATFFTLLVLWTAFGSIVALLLGYSRIPYAAAADGAFFKWFGVLHETKHFPHRSLLLMGGVALACSFLKLDFVINALLTSRILIQFIGQIGAVVLLRKKLPPEARPFKMWLYPLPCLVALAGWIFLFVTSDKVSIAVGLGVTLLGLGAYAIWSRRNPAPVAA